MWNSPGRVRSGSKARAQEPLKVIALVRTRRVAPVMSFFSSRSLIRPCVCSSAQQIDGLPGDVRLVGEVQSFGFSSVVAGAKVQERGFQVQAQVRPEAVGHGQKFGRTFRQFQAQGKHLVARMQGLGLVGEMQSLGHLGGGLTLSAPVGHGQGQGYAGGAENQIAGPFGQMLVQVSGQGGLTLDHLLKMARVCGAGQDQADK